MHNPAGADHIRHARGHTKSNPHESRSHALVVCGPVLEVDVCGLRVGRGGAVGVRQQALDRREEGADGVAPGPSGDHKEGSRGQRKFSGRVGSHG